MLLHGGCVRSVVTAGRTPAADKAAVVVMRRQVLNAAESGDSDPIASGLRAQMTAEPGNVNPRLQLAAHYGKRGLQELQLEHLRLAVERFPESREARWQLAQALRKAGLRQEAAATLASFVQAAKGGADAEVLNLLGICYDDTGEWTAGEEAYRKALALDPNFEPLYNNLGFNLLEQGRTTEAIAALEQALKRNRGSVVARNNLGLALAQTAAVDDAVRHFENVTDASTAYSNAAAALIEQRRYAESRRLLQAALDYNPRNAAALANLQLVSEQDGQPAEIRWHAAGNRWRSPLAVLRHVLGRTEAKPKADSPTP